MRKATTRVLNKRKKIVKHISTYRGTLITFQHYLNTHYFVLPMEEANSGNQVYDITEWYKNGILVKIEIKLKAVK